MATYRLMQARIRNPPSAGLKVDRRFLRDPPGDPGSEAATRALATGRSRQLPVPGGPAAMRGGSAKRPVERGCETGERNGSERAQGRERSGGEAPREPESLRRGG
jgi:hypothetical protein